MHLFATVDLGTCSQLGVAIAIDAERGSSQALFVLPPRRTNACALACCASSACSLPTTFVVPDAVLSTPDVMRGRVRGGLRAHDTMPAPIHVTTSQSRTQHTTCTCTQSNAQIEQLFRLLIRIQQIIEFFRRQHFYFASYMQDMWVVFCRFVRSLSVYILWHCGVRWSAGITSDLLFPSMSPIFFLTPRNY